MTKQAMNKYQTYSASEITLIIYEKGKRNFWD